MPPGRFGDGFYGNHWWGMLSWGFSTLLWLALLGLIVWAAVRYFQHTQTSASTLPPPAPSALELLRQRYVLGEIDLETFETMHQHIMASEEAERTGTGSPWEAPHSDYPEANL
ncbi:MAG TPA: hypothetical protein VF116_14485 [Ktedonobacterales bacterium]